MNQVTHSAPRLTAMRGLLTLAALGLSCIMGVPGAHAQSTAPDNRQATTTAHASPASQSATTDLPILPLDDVRIGMKGYGLSVFHGTRIEPFEVEVISIQRDFSPQRGVIWIRCPDERMQASGPVQGMSGSPIFLWEPGQEQTLGQGGRLIGAFAFGYQLSKDCYVGVQPIEFMLETAGRMEAQPAPSDSSAATRPGDPAQGAMLLRRFIAAAIDQGVAPRDTQLARLHADWLAPNDMKRQAALRDDLPAGPAELASLGQPRRLLVPLTVSSPLIAKLMTPVLEPLGLAPLAGAEVIAARPPAEIDPAGVAFAPGSVLSVPLAWGDMDLSASGTVTALTSQGDVMGFGHAMFGQGPTALPMATGYVHFVMPTLTTSFKLGGSLQLKGALLRDEQAAVVGSSKGTYKTSPVRVSVAMPGHPTRQFHYQIAHHRELTPILAAILAMQSVGTVQDPPTLNSLHVTGTLKFNEDQVIHIDTLAPMAGPMTVAMQMISPLMLMANNPFDSRQVESVEITATFMPEVKVSSITRAAIARPVVRPGETAVISVWLQPYGGEIQRKTVTLEIPATLPDGDYQLILGGANLYNGLLMSSRPHLSNITNLDTLFHFLKRTSEVDNTAMYLMLQSNETGLAIGRQELPQLPSSRAALLAGSASTDITPYQEWVEKKIDTEHVIEGQQALMIQVRRWPDQDSAMR